MRSHELAKKLLEGVDLPVELCIETRDAKNRSEVGDCTVIADAFTVKLHCSGWIVNEDDPSWSEMEDED